MSGLGAVFTYQTNFGRAKATVVTYLYKFIMRGTSTAVIVENEDDRHTFSSKVGLAEKQIHLIPGVGVDMNQFFPVNRRSSGNLRVALVSRLLYDKRLS